ncbi:MAG: transglutaminase-like domain-containing protein, partial [Spirochaetales bacterium]|nr:transglutaminase-like domain-containing protein [Spirochaetales bacterium]
VYGVIHHSLNSTGEWLLMGFFALVPLLAAAGEFFPSGRSIMHRAAVGLMILQGVLIVGEILVLPYQAYELWFELFRTGTEQGRVSHIFVKLGTFLAVLICWVIARQKNLPKAARDFLYLPFFFLFLLHPSLPAALFFFAALLLSRLRKDNYRGLLSLLIVLMPVGLTGIKSPSKGASFIDNSSDNLITWMIEAWPSLPLLYDVPLYGESFSESVETGGRPVLTGHGILEVEGLPGEQLYLRTAVTIQPGKKGPSLSLRHFSPIVEVNTANLDYLSVRVITDFMNTVPYTDYSAYLNLAGDLYALETKELTLLPDKPLLYGDEYTLIMGRESQGEKELPRFDFSPYLESDQEPSEELLTLAASLKGDDRESTADNIRAYLAANYRYTLDTEESPAYTEEFLFRTGEGYCLHFATSFAVLARINGIPCRFVEGYLVNIPEEEDEFDDFGINSERVAVQVTGLNSHIWPEVYFEESGWVPYEVTTPFYRNESPVEQNNLTTRQLNEIRRDRESAPKESPLQETNPLYYGALPLLLILIWTFTKMRALIRQAGKHTLLIIRRYVRTASSLGIEQPRTSGWVEWGRGINEEIPAARTVMERVMPLILKARYSGKSLSEEEQEQLHRDYHEFKNLCRMK